MRKNLYLVASFLLITSISFAGGSVHYSKNKAEKSYRHNEAPDLDYQSQLRNHYAWKNFRSHHGEWWVQFNEENRKPHRAFGVPISVAGATAEQKAMNFIQFNLNEFKIPVSELVLANTYQNEKHQFVNYYQVHDGLRVLDSRMTVKLSNQGQVIMFGADVYNDINVDTNPTITSAGAINAATSDITGEVITNSTVNSNLFILPTPYFKSNVFHLVYEVNVETDDNGIPANYHTLVDAHTGEVLYRANTVNHFDPDHGDHKKGGAIEVEVEADVYEYNPYIAAATLPLANLEFTVGATTYNTDGNGFLQTAASGTQSATFRLRGLWSNVLTNGNNPNFTTTVNDGLNTISFNSDANIRQLSAYYHVNIVHDYMKSWLPSFTGMDISLQTNVDLTSGDCNAFYNGTSINFYALANGCNSLAQVGDVVYHEYGHGINDKFYQSLSGSFNNGSMGEGYADIWALSITESPIMGSGFYTTNTDGIRRYDQDPVLFEFGTEYEVHYGGEIICGAWWDTYLNMGSDMNAMMTLFIAAYPGLQAVAPNGLEGQAFTDVLIDALQADDDDANLMNGTPNGQAIIDGFKAHNITLISNVDIQHTQLIAANHSTAITVNASLDWVNTNFSVYMNDFNCNYKVNNGSWVTIPMNNIGGNNYSADLPAQPIGTVIAYYFFADDINGNIGAVNPIGAERTDANVPYYILVGYDLKRTDDGGDNLSEFGNFSTGLGSDNNSTGTWILSIPTGSYSTVGDTSTAVQPYYQKTPGGELCYLTANAPSATDAVGTADVDAGHTTLRSAVFDVSGYMNPAITYQRWYTNSPPTGANPGADWWQVEISNDGGTSWTYVENTKVSDQRWRRNAFRIADYVTPTSTMRLRFIASDSTRIGQNLDGGSLVEAAVDDIQLWDNTINSVNENSGVLNVMIYPNPASGQLNLSIDLLEETTVKYEVYDVTGKLVDASSIGKIGYGNHLKTINIASLATGSYTIKFVSESTTFISKFMKE